MRDLLVNKRLKLFFKSDLILKWIHPVGIYLLVYIVFTQIIVSPQNLRLFTAKDPMYMYHNTSLSK